MAKEDERMVQAVQKQRVFAFDELRGVMILSMLVYHICYDLAELVRLKGMNWFYSEAAGWWQLSICGAFILVSGACCAYSRNNLKRGLKLLGLGMLFTLVTVLATAAHPVWFAALFGDSRTAFDSAETSAGAHLTVGRTCRRTVSVLADLLVAVGQNRLEPRSFSRTAVCLVQHLLFVPVGVP